MRGKLAVSAAVRASLAAVSGCIADRHPSPQGKKGFYCGSTWEACLKEACSVGEVGRGGVKYFFF